MKAAKSQTQDLDQTGTFLTTLLSPEQRENKLESPQAPENASQKVVNGKPRVSRIESISRFSEPPAPPPQQPLPEKPDVVRTSPIDSSNHTFLKRSDTAKAGAGLSGSPTGPHSSQILTLVEALSSAKKELESQAARVKNLEDLLQQERSARESAEERARRLESNASARPVPEDVELADTANTDYTEVPRPPRPWSEVNGTTHVPTADVAASTDDTLQDQLDAMVAQMAEMKKDLEQYHKRAEVAEDDASTTRTSLAEMVSRLRKENAAAADEAEKELDGVLKGTDGAMSPDATTSTSSTSTLSKSGPYASNGPVRAPSRLPEQLERALANVLRDSNGNPDMLAQTAPYASMLGVVLLGVGLMAYLNSWQKAKEP